MRDRNRDVSTVLTRLAAVCRAGGVTAVALAIVFGTACREEPTPLDAASTGRVLEATLDLRIGSYEEPETALTWVTDAAGSPGGRIFIAQPLDGQVRTFDWDGRPLGLLGGPGGGPGEFFRPELIGWLDGRLWVADPGRNRVSFFDSAGALLASHGFLLSATEEWLSPRLRGALGDTLALFDYTGPAAWFEDGIIAEVPAVSARPDGRIVARLATLSAANQVLGIRRPGDSVGALFGRQPFSDAPLLASTPAGHVVVVERDAASAEQGATFRVLLISARGDTLRSRAFGYVPKAPPEEVMRAAVARWTGPVLETRRASTRTEASRLVRAALYLPRFLPPVSALALGGDGTLWLRREPTGTGEVTWWQLDEALEKVAEVRLPEGLEVHDAGEDWILGSTRDELGVDTVERYSLEAPRQAAGHP